MKPSCAAVLLAALATLPGNSTPARAAKPDAVERARDAGVRYLLDHQSDDGAWRSKVYGHFRGGDATHGSMFHRAPGSIGASSFPSRVFPGMRMSGHMGTARVTVRNLEIVEVDGEDNVILVKGAVPGPNGGYVIVRRAKQ